MEVSLDAPFTELLLLSMALESLREVTLIGDKMSDDILGLLDPVNRINKLLDAQDDVVQQRDIDGKYHPSGISGCARKLSYAWLKERPKHRIGNSLRRTFQHGHSIHDMLQAWMTKVYNGDIDGYWTTFSAELPIGNTELAQQYNIAGSTDGLITLTCEGKDPIKVIYEAKSASVSSWNNVGSPMPKHIEQANIYAACLGAEHILFDYYNKSADKHKYFLVPFSPELWDATIAKLTLVTEKIVLGELMPREHSSFECRSCGYYYTCKPELNT